MQGAATSEGYRDLAHLIAAGYFELALSTNLDNLLERALNDAGRREPEHFVVSVNGRDKPEDVRYQLESSRALREGGARDTLRQPRAARAG
jgi:hypothetical protein